MQPNALHHSLEALPTPDLGSVAVKEYFEIGLRPRSIPVLQVLPYFSLGIIPGRAAVLVNS